MNDLWIGNNAFKLNYQAIEGDFVELENEIFYQIRNYDLMSPFFISLASDSDHWMYVSSTGGLTAGRKNPDNAIFPYYTEDKLHDASENTGSKTILHVFCDKKWMLWEPFSMRHHGIYQLERNIAKSTVGNKLIFSEKNEDLGLTFSYIWMNSTEFGWIKKSCLVNDSDNDIEIILLDGLQNILPYGVDQLTQNRFSTLVDAYKRTELIQEHGLALFRMESIMVDRAEPAEALKATTVWNFGLENASYLLSSNQLNAFRQGKEVSQETESKGVRGAFFAQCRLKLKPSEPKKWYFVADLEQDATRIVSLINIIHDTEDLPKTIEKSVIQGSQSLKSMVEQADGIQKSADLHTIARHFSNVLFNSMRGGIYDNNYLIKTTYFCSHIRHFNKEIWNQYKNLLSELPETINYSELGQLIEKQNDEQLTRLYYEYLPLTFSRRHGDPSRPWNLFNIRVKDEQGNKLLAYQGNWRDIFQNWEALSLSFPEFIHGIISKFINASTPDGYNPYKVTSEGIDWEVIEHDNPWSNIGYWGDHQIIYLLRLLELSRNYFPEFLDNWQNKNLFAYANVPYRLKNYEDILKNPRNSIVFDDDLHQRILNIEKTYGADARLVLDENGKVLQVNLTEKILASLLSKMSNFVPGAGIWMNTLRPEWNDANNALVGFGASMVTVYHLRRFVLFLLDLFNGSSVEAFNLSIEVFGFFADISKILKDNAEPINEGIDNQKRKQIADALGIAGSNFRSQIYKGFAGKKAHLRKAEMIEFLMLCSDFINKSIEENKRDDNMFHSYNLLTFNEKEISIRNLYEMLEGQVAVLNSGYLAANETLELLDSLRNSALYRADQNSYILYPNKQLPKFLEKNNISSNDIKSIPLLRQFAEIENNSIISKDKKGNYHFNATFRNANHLEEALNRLKADHEIKIDEKDVAETLALYEKLFDHQSFTGRSGTFYKYEGLGCIYWHMVSKLLLAVGESISRFSNLTIDNLTISRLKTHYFEIQKGIGSHKKPGDYGSFPFDPYSHTPLMAGVQQPGMTGQVKEDIISRFIELGINVENGQLSINPVLLQNHEFIKPENTENKKFNAPHLGFTYCAVPFVYLADGKSGIEIQYKNGQRVKQESNTLNQSISKSIFSRSADIEQILVHL